MGVLPIKWPREAIEAFCLRHHIRKLSLFGSVLTPRFGPNSDIDLLVEFEPGQRIGLFAMAGMELELSELLGRKVDLRSPEEISKYFRDKVVAGALLIYDARRD